MAAPKNGGQPGWHFARCSGTANPCPATANSISMGSSKADKKEKKERKEKKQRKEKSKEHKKSKSRSRLRSDSSSSSGDEGPDVNTRLAMGRAAVRATREILAYNYALRTELREVMQGVGRQGRAAALAPALDLAPPAGRDGRRLAPPPVRS